MTSSEYPNQACCSAPDWARDEWNDNKAECQACLAVAVRWDPHGPWVVTPGSERAQANREAGRWGLG